MLSPVSTVISDHLWWVYCPGIRPTRPGHPILVRCNEYCL